MSPLLFAPQPNSWPQPHPKASFDLDATMRYVNVEYAAAASLALGWLVGGARAVVKGTIRAGLDA